ncbi:hypothetical protein GMRT_12425 [Giardia muris]|uniref:Uncharacterized protein n=1 Tax=Giardia muris TaxID=5742 RepID=A0A4Z1T2F5_GIAMU|nr:hypothetical protein GMRT_12425 [Giardia muris]|eukprot:TNJ27217.1 hypothetical protein GMRT_12425 [Giardia muris]
MTSGTRPLGAPAPKNPRTCLAGQAATSPFYLAINRLMRTTLLQTRIGLAEPELKSPKTPSLQPLSYTPPGTAPERPTSEVSPTIPPNILPPKLGVKVKTSQRRVGIHAIVPLTQEMYLQVRTSFLWSCIEPIASEFATALQAVDPSSLEAANLRELLRSWALLFGYSRPYGRILDWQRWILRSLPPPSSDVPTRPVAQCADTLLATVIFAASQIE